MFGWNSVALFYFIKNKVKTPECVDLWTDIIDGTTISMFLLIELFILIFFIMWFVKEKLKKNYKETFKRNLTKVYKNIYSKDFNVELFISVNKTVIDTVPLNEEEYAILKDRFTTKFNPEEQYQPEQCCICISEFNNDTL